MVIDLMDIILALLVGALLSVFFFVGLWWTVRQLGSSQHVALLFLCSMLVRTGVVVMGFYFILGDSWEQLLAGLFGFFVMRLIVMRYFAVGESSLAIEQRSDYAP